jgi:Kdo2-lipid IVA lauroyltransferase/acyltransferase
VPASVERPARASSVRIEAAGARGERIGGFGGWLARAIGSFSIDAIPTAGAFLGWLVGTVFRIRRAHVERSMKRAGIVRSRASMIAAAMYRSLGASLVEMLWLAAHPEVPASRLASTDEWSRARLGEEKARGRGVVLATAHAGNWELAAAALAEEYPVTVVVKPMSVGWVDRFCRSARGARGIGLAAPDDALRHSREALARGEIVAMLIDQVPARAAHAIVTEFLCATADVDRSAAALAAAMRVPLAVSVCRRTDDGDHVLEILALLEPPERDRRAWVAAATRTATRVLERWVHAHPTEWLWMHRRWRPAPGRVPKGEPGSAVHQLTM